MMGHYSYGGQRARPRGFHKSHGYGNILYNMKER